MKINQFTNKLVDFIDIFSWWILALFKKILCWILNSFHKYKLDKYISSLFIEIIISKEVLLYLYISLLLPHFLLLRTQYLTQFTFYHQILTTQHLYNMFHLFLLLPISSHFSSVKMLSAHLRIVASLTFSASLYS